MSSVCSSSALWSSVDLDVAQNQVIGVKLFDLGISFEVGQEVQNDLDGLDWPSTLGDSEFAGLGSSTSSTCISSVWDTSLVLKNLIEVLLGSLDRHSLQNSSGIVGVLEVSTEVVTSSLDG